MIKRSILILVALSLVFPLISANATDLNERLWDIRIKPTEDGSGKFTFDASLKHSFTGEGSSSKDELRVPRMTVVPGEEANIEMKGPDGRPVVTARVLIGEGGMKVRYSVMIRAEGGVHSSSADLNLSANQAR
jgi:hypothetical protein